MCGFLAHLCTTRFGNVLLRDAGFAMEASAIEYMR